MANKKPRKKAAQNDSQQTDIQLSLFTVPSSPESNLIMEVFGAGKNVHQLPDRKGLVNRNAKYDVYEDGPMRRIEFSSTSSSIILEIIDIDKFKGTNTAAKKLFIHVLRKMNEQALHNGILTQSYISFPLEELVDIGLYKVSRSARAGFIRGRDMLTSIKINSVLKKKGTGQKPDVSKDDLIVLFIRGTIENGQCYVFPNPLLNWSALAQFYMLLPPYYYPLPSRASELLLYIFYIARQHTKEIKERGYFTISFRAIQSRLQLPSEVGNNNPDRTIKQEIEKAVEAIEDAHREYYGNEDFYLELVYDEKSHIAEYLDNGYLKVMLKGSFADSFIELSNRAEKQVEEAKDKRSKKS